MARIVPVNRLRLSSMTVAGSVNSLISGSGSVTLADLLISGSGSASNGNAPFLMYQSITAGPTSGGEDSKGTYLAIYGLNLGNFSDYGTSNHVTIGGVEVDNYRCLVDSVAPYWAALGVKGIICQVGALTGLSNGTAYPIEVTVGGTGPSNPTSGSNYLDPFGDALTFTPQPGSIVFVSTGGNNSNVGTIAAPLLDLQTSAGTGGALKIHSGANTTDGTHPGTHVILRGGTFTNAGLNGRWVDLFRITGLAPSGASDRGPICVMAYPGAAGANSPEIVTWDGASGDGGGFNGNDSTRANEVSTSYGGFTGWCQYMQIHRINVAVDAGSGGDCGPFNTQNTGRWWRIIDCGATWPSTVTGGSHGRSAGIEGSPQDGRFYGNYIHDIDGDTSANENHGVYMDGHSSGSGNVANRNQFGFNHIQDIGAGNGIQFYDGTNGAGMTGNKVAWNFIKTTNKHGLNIADNTGPLTAWNNVIVDAGEDSIRVSTSTALGTNGICLTNNVLYGWQRVYSAAARYALANESTYTGSVRLENNIVMQRSGYASSSFNFVLDSGGTLTQVKNRWYDPTGVRTSKPAGDSTGSYGTPSFTSASTDDFTLADGSACIDAGNTPTGITRSYGMALNVAPDGSHDQGAFERAV